MTLICYFIWNIMLSSFNILVAKSRIHDGLDIMLTWPLHRGQHFLPDIWNYLWVNTAPFMLYLSFIVLKLLTNFFHQYTYSTVVCFNTQLLQSLRHGTSKCQQLLALLIYLCFLISPEQAAYLRGESRWLYTTTQSYVPSCMWCML